MARGISKTELVPYVLEGDRGLDEKEQTVFYIKPKTGHESNVQTKMYMKAITEKPDGSKDMDVSQTDAADIANFKVTVRKIENYAFPQEEYENKKAMRESAIEKELVDDLGNKETIWFTEEITDPVMIEKVAKTLPSKALRELTQVSEDMSKLKEGEKKD